MNHPFDPLSVEEVETSARIIREHFKGQSLLFNSITRLEPKKSLLFPKLLEENEGTTVDFNSIERKSFTVLILKDKEGEVVEVVVNLSRKEIESLKNVEGGKQPTFTPDECITLEKLTLENPDIQKKCREMGYDDMELVVADPWPYGYFGDEPGYENRRIAQMFMYAKEFKEDNHYAHPMNFVPVFDVHSGKLIKIMEQPAHSEFDPKSDPDLKPSRECGNYEEKLLDKSFYRASLKPLHITNPEGVNFKVNGNLIEWEKFRLRISFNQREGLVLHNVTYTDGNTVRPLLYRAALSEMVVPYGDPRPPFHRKCAFDVGESSLGFCVNSLALGCDCLGTIKYFDAILNNEKGEPTLIKNAVCLHEEDAGILWKHTNYRTGSVSVVRSRILVLSFIVTVVNYEYGFYWKFAQDGTISYEVKATGILSTNLLASSETDPQFGTKVAENVIAQYHQHLFCVRMDTMIDGLENTVSTVDVVPLSSDDPKNPHGHGFTVVEKKLKTSKESCTQISPFTSRTWKISNSNSINQVTGKPSSWKLIPNNSRTLIAHPDSEISKRAAFARNSVCVTPFNKDDDDDNPSELYAAGFYVNQSQGKNDDGLAAWISDSDNTEDTDIILWHTFGLTHIPRVEDYPVMPVETCGFTLKPFNFFVSNPALDVPGPNSNKNGQSEKCCSQQVH